MKNNILIILGMLFFMSGVNAQKIIFLHHSSGGNLYTEGHVGDYLVNYNATHGTNLQITEFNYPNSPWPWENFPYDYWKLWVNGSCNNADKDIQCIDKLAAQYNIIVFKHCYPGARIEPDLGTPDITSERKSLENYKLQYRALRGLMDRYPATKFVVWTLVPLHRLTTNAATAGRAYEFVNWVKSGWLTEDGKAHPNIYVFDFFSLAAELDQNPKNGARFCLKYEYERSHTDANSHPNLVANQSLGPVFAQYIANVATGAQACSGDIDSNGAVDGNDYLLLLGKFGTNCSASCTGDIDGNRVVDGSDLLLLLRKLFLPCTSD